MRRRLNNGWTGQASGRGSLIKKLITDDLGWGHKSGTVADS